MFLPQRVAIQNFMEIQLRPNKLPNYGCSGFTCLIIMLDIWMFHPYTIHVYYVKFISMLCLYMLPFFGGSHIDCSIHDIQGTSSIMTTIMFPWHTATWTSTTRLGKKKQFFAKGYAERMPFFDKPTLGAQCRSDLWCPERWRIWGRFHRSELAGHPAILKLSDFTGNPVLRCLQPTKHGDFSRTIQVPRFLWNEATPLYPIVYDHPNPAMGQTQNRRSLP